MVLLRDFGQVETRFGPFEDLLISTQDRYTVCAKRTISLEIILDAPNYTPPGNVDQVEAHFDPFRDNLNLGAR
jgi:hypothetical protein